MKETNKKKKQHQKIKRPGIIADTIFMMICVFIILFPIFLIIRKSFYIRGFGNYKAVFEGGLMTNVVNSLIVSCGTIAIDLCLILPAAYAFSRFRFKGARLFYYLAIIGMMVPSVILLVPIMVMGKNLHLMNNLLGVILPMSALTSPFMLLILKNSIDDQPMELYEAAFVDGCSRWKMLFLVCIPLSKPTLLTIVLFIFMDSWNEYLLPLALLRKPELMTVTVIPSRFYEEFGQDQPKIFAASVLIVLPVVLLYLLLQRYFDEGFTTGAIKG